MKLAKRGKQREKLEIRIDDYQKAVASKPGFRKPGSMNPKRN